MQPNQDYQKILTEVIKKQILLLGPTIALSRARSVRGLVVADDGTIQSMQGEPTQLIQAVIEQFVQLSGLIIKNALQPLLEPVTTNVIQNIQQVAPTVNPSSFPPGPQPKPANNPLAA